MDVAVSRRVAVFALPLAVALAGCDVNLGNLTARGATELIEGDPGKQVFGSGHVWLALLAIASPVDHDFVQLGNGPTERVSST